ncbi:MAG: iron-sulfur cluster assembly scaffold protein [Actinomycetia bacterium]|nr:iron-sulfur cluster assembly scaffold protein [Actinomycetes bacterium]
MPRFSECVIDHFTNPRNCGRVPDPDVAAFVGNPVCGDQILLTARVGDDTVGEIAFEAFGCSAALAVASILTERLTGMPIPDVAVIDQTLVAGWSGGLAPDQQHVAVLGADVAHRLAENYRGGVLDDAPVSAG